MMLGLDMASLWQVYERQVFNVLKTWQSHYLINIAANKSLLEHLDLLKITQQNNLLKMYTMKRIKTCGILIFLLFSYGM